MAQGSWQDKSHLTWTRWAREKLQKEEKEERHGEKGKDQMPKAEARATEPGLHWSATGAMEQDIPKGYVQRQQDQHRLPNVGVVKESGIGQARVHRSEVGSLCRLTSVPKAEGKEPRAWRRQQHGNNSKLRAARWPSQLRDSPCSRTGRPKDHGCRRQEDQRYATQ